MYKTYKSMEEDAAIKPAELFKHSLMLNDLKTELISGLEDDIKERNQLSLNNNSKFMLTNES